MKWLRTMPLIGTIDCVCVCVYSGDWIWDFSRAKVQNVPLASNPHPSNVLMRLETGRNMRKER